MSTYYLIIYNNLYITKLIKLLTSNNNNIKKSDK